MILTRSARRSVQVVYTILLLADTAQLAGSTNLLGTAGVNTPFNVFDNTDLVVNVSQVPEPGTIALLGLGLLGIGVYSRKRIKN